MVTNNILMGTMRPTVATVRMHAGSTLCARAEARAWTARWRPVQERTPTAARPTGVGQAGPLGDLKREALCRGREINSGRSMETGKSARAAVCGGDMTCAAVRRPSSPDWAAQIWTQIPAMSCGFVRRQGNAVEQTLTVQPLRKHSQLSSHDQRMAAASDSDRAETPLKKLTPTEIGSDSRSTLSPSPSPVKNFEDPFRAAAVAATQRSASAKAARAAAAERKTPEAIDEGAWTGDGYLTNRIIELQRQKSESRSEMLAEMMR